MAGEDEPYGAVDQPRPDAAQRLELRTIVAGTALIALIILVTATVLTWHLRQTRYADGENALEKFDLMLAEQSARVFDGIDIVLAGLQHDLQSNGIATPEALHDTQSLPAAHEELRFRMSGMPQLDALFIVGTNGFTINSSRFFPMPPNDVSNRDYFVTLRDHPELTRFVSASTVNRLTGQRVVYLGRRLSAPDGSFLGVVVGALKIAYFQDFYRDIALDGGNAVALFRDDSLLLARFPVPPPELGESFHTKISFADLPSDQFLVSHLTGQIRQEPLIQVSRRVPGYPLVAAVTTSIRTLLAPWRQQTIGIASASVIMILTICLAAWLMIRQIAAAERLAGARAEIDRESGIRRQLEIAVEETRISEERLRLSEQHLRYAQELGSMGSFERSFNQDIFTWSSETYRIFGVDPARFVPTLDNIIPLIHPDDRAQLRGLRTHIGGSDDERTIEYRITRPDGAIRMIRRRAAAMHDEHGAVVGYMGILQDITDQHRAMVRLALLQSISLAIAETDDFYAALGEVLRSLCEATDSAYAEAWIPDTGGTELVRGPVWHRDVESLAAYAHDRRDLRLKPGAGHIAKAWKTKQPVWVPDLVAARQVQLSMLRRANSAGINSAYVVPILSGDEVLAILRFAMLGTREWDDSLTEITTAVAAQLGTALQQKHVERQLRQAQKMEAVGNLTGGLAHDFNNLLGVIIGNLELLGDGLRDGDEELKELSGDALEAAHRGADLTRRLLAFARRQPLQPVVTDANELIGGIYKLLGRTIGEQIEFRLSLAAEVWPITIDPAQLEAAITNLATNARDAMPKGGHLSITTRNVLLDGDYAAMHWDVAPGEYVLIEVNDSGSGMPPEVVAHIFEPFFTTKEEGKGSGLGLSMVFGFIKQSGGHLTVYSEPGHGTSFCLYLPRSKTPLPPPPAVKPRPTLARGDESILLVEDNDMMRTVVTKQLTDLGYLVRTVDGAGQALDVLADGHRIDLLFTDVVMPGEMDGFALAEEAMQRYPGIKVLLTSGFPETRLGTRLTTRLLSKPYSKEELARAIRAAIDETS